MDKENMYYILKKGTNDRVRNKGKPYALDKVHGEWALKHGYGAHELISIEDYEKIFGK